MSKPVLGRGLGKLLKEAKGSATPEPAGDKPKSSSPGMTTLLRGANGSPNEESAQTETPSPTAGNPRGKRLLQISLIVADVVLLALAARLVFKSEGHFGFLEVTLCILAFGLGAWLSCLAFWRDPS